LRPYTAHSTPHRSLLGWLAPYREALLGSLAALLVTYTAYRAGKYAYVRRKVGRPRYATYHNPTHKTLYRTHHTYLFPVDFSFLPKPLTNKRAASHWT
jgi:hypothetical protein